ncbi:hypothetical protein OIU79_023623 [Salix purpurea]|uniref:Uncharacterized protein n=1 Tax=Salix purpurea TaxID=77065 RepID=A0A9Q0W969_SALPP|nr:hypothetical protein OIU79_023623 [Salix purpurea]
MSIWMEAGPKMMTMTMTMNMSSSLACFQTVLLTMAPASQPHLQFHKRKFPGTSPPSILAIGCTVEKVNAQKMEHTDTRVHAILVSLIFSTSLTTLATAQLPSDLTVMTLLKSQTQHHLEMEQPQALILLAPFFQRSSNGWLFCSSLCLWL